MTEQLYLFLASSLASPISFYGETAKGHEFLAEHCGAGVLPGF